MALRATSWESEAIYSGREMGGGLGEEKIAERWTAFRQNLSFFSLFSPLLLFFNFIFLNPLCLKCATVSDYPD